MHSAPLSNEQSRQLIDVAQVYDVYRRAQNDAEHGFRATMQWKKSKGIEYLYRTTRHKGKAVSRIVGRRSPETEKLKNTYEIQRRKIRTRVDALRQRLNEMARVNRALRLNRIPMLESRILNALDVEGLLGAPLFIVGTNALYAYELRAGVLISSALLATADLDLLFDHRRLSLVVSDKTATSGILGLLKDIDSTFERVGPRGFRAANDTGFLVDLIQPIERGLRKKLPATLGRNEEDLYAVEIAGLEWLIHSPKISEMVIGHDGRPLTMSCIDPRAFALHKMWVSERPDRDPKQKVRDRAQAECVAELCDGMSLSFNDKILSSLPAPLRAARQRLSQTVKAR